MSSNVKRSSVGFEPLELAERSDSIGPVALPGPNGFHVHNVVGPSIRFSGISDDDNDARPRPSNITDSPPYVHLHSRSNSHFTSRPLTEFEMAELTEDQLEWLRNLSTQDLRDNLIRRGSTRLTEKHCLRAYLQLHLLYNNIGIEVQETFNDEDDPVDLDKLKLDMLQAQIDQMQRQLNNKEMELQAAEEAFKLHLKVRVGELGGGRGRSCTHASNTLCSIHPLPTLHRTVSSPRSAQRPLCSAKAGPRNASSLPPSVSAPVSPPPLPRLRTLWWLSCPRSVLPRASC